MLQGVLFDMDGVLFDTERIGWRLEKEVAAEMGFEFSADIQAKICGANHEQGRKVVLETFGPAFDYDAYSDILHNRMTTELKRNGVPKKPGVDNLLAFLKENRYRIGLASSTQHNIVVGHLKNTGIYDYFDGIIGGDMVPASKPAPDIFETAAKAIGVTPALCAAIEDSVNGVMSAAAAGCVTIMVPDLMPPTEKLRKVATTVLDSLTEVPAFLAEYNRTAFSK